MYDFSGNTFNCSLCFLNLPDKYSDDDIYHVFVFLTSKRNTMICDCEQCDLKKLFFGAVSNEELQTICSQKEERNYPKGEVIIKEGSEIHDFIYMKSGLVKLFRQSGDEEQIIAIAKPYDFVSLLSVFSEKYYHYSVTALEDTTVCVLSMSLISGMLQKNCAFACNVITQMSKVSDAIIMNMLNICERHLRGRVAYILVYFSETIYRQTVFDLPLSRKEIAAFIGMTTENVIRTLSEFRKDGIINIYGKRIEITNPERLRKVSMLG